MIDLDNRHGRFSSSKKARAQISSPATFDSIGIAFLQLTSLLTTCVTYLTLLVKSLLIGLVRLIYKNGWKVSNPSAALVSTDGSEPVDYLTREHMFPFKSGQFRKHMGQLSDFIINYVRNPQKFKVTTDQSGGFVYKRLPTDIPEEAETFDNVMKDVEEILMPGMTHWQHPRFHGYVPTGFSYPDVLSEALISGLAIMSFGWRVSPSFAELEIVVVNMVAKALNLPSCFHFDLKNAEKSPGGGALTNSSSDAILLSMFASRGRIIRREVAKIKETGQDFDEHLAETQVLGRLVAYTSCEAHACIEKAARLCRVRLHSIPANESTFAMDVTKLEQQMSQDVKDGLLPFHVHLTAGTTNLAAVDPIKEAAIIAKKHDAWVHVDGAWGAAELVCPEYRCMFEGLDLVDSLNLSLHKMFLMSVPAGIFWCRSQADIQITMNSEAEYLKCEQGKSEGAVEFRHWGTNLGRRPICLRVWFVLRMHGAKGIREYVRRMNQLRETFQRKIEQDPRFEIVGIPRLSMMAFRVKNASLTEANRQTRELSEYVNDSNRILMTRVCPLKKLEVIRFNVCHQLSTEEDILESYRIFDQLATEYFRKSM